MPQITQIDAIWASQLFWLLLTFGFTFLVAGLYMYPRIQGTVDNRDNKIKADLESARLAGQAADNAEEAYRVKINEDRAAAQKTVAEAKAQAAKSAEEQVAQVDAELDAKITAAEAEISAQKNSAMADIADAAAEAAQDIVKQLSGKTVQKATALKKVQAELA